MPKLETRQAGWRPTLGTWLSPEGISFRVWAPNARSVDVLLEGDPLAHSLEKTTDGVFRGLVSQARTGDLYRYRIDGQGSFPDPVSRFQPQGVHGPSQIIDPHAFVWSDSDWRGISSLEESVMYELHVGTFTPLGTFEGAAQRLSYLADLGVTAIELMPIADFPGRFNWGYDGVSLFAPARAYGGPDDLRRLVNAAHRARLGVILDVVYNHLGPDGNYLNAYSPYYFNSRHPTPWGSAVNLDGEQAAGARRYFIENALHWIHEYHFDGLRLDATHAMKDESRRHFLAELSEHVHASTTGRHVELIAEDCRNLSQIVKPPEKGGWGLDGVWSDDFHHQVRRSLAGDHEGYYRDFSGSMEDLVATIEKGWFFCGQPSAHFGGPRGTDPMELPLSRFVFFNQNHDQIGNRAFGERLHQQIDEASYRAATVLLLSAPETPLLFMGQEWAASTPFLYFTDHEKNLGSLVTQGRREEFKDYSAFADPAARERIPDPQDPATFERSRLRWGELDQPRHAAVRGLFKALLMWRQKTLVPLKPRRKNFQIKSLGADALWMEYRQGQAPRIWALIQWRGAGQHDIPMNARDSWDTALSTEEARFSSDPKPIAITRNQSNMTLSFSRPGAVILQTRPL